MAGPAVLDGMDDDTDREDGRTPNPLCAPAGHNSHVVWLRGADSDEEARVPAPVAASGAPLPWSCRGNVFTAIGGVVLDLAGSC